MPGLDTGDCRVPVISFREEQISHKGELTTLEPICVPEASGLCVALRKIRPA